MRRRSGEKFFKLYLSDDSYVNSERLFLQTVFEGILYRVTPAP